MFKAVLITIQLISCSMLIVFILLHAGRGGGLSDMFGGSSPSTLGGSTVVEKNLDRITVVNAVILFINTTLLVSVLNQSA